MNIHWNATGFFKGDMLCSFPAPSFELCLPVVLCKHDSQFKYVFYTGSWLPIANRCEQQVAEAAVLTDRGELINIFMISDTEARVDLFNMSIVWMLGIYVTENKERCHRSDLILPCIYIYCFNCFIFSLFNVLLLHWKIMPNIRSHPHVVRITLAHRDMDTGCLAPGCSTFMSCGLYNGSSMDRAASCSTVWLVFGKFGGTTYYSLGSLLLSMGKVPLFFCMWLACNKV